MQRCKGKGQQKRKNNTQEGWKGKIMLPKANLNEKNQKKGMQRKKG